MGEERSLDEAARRVARLRGLDSCAVSDALDKLGLTGCVTGLRPLSMPARIAGVVRTVRLVAAGPDARQHRPGVHLGATAVERSGVDDVIVVEQRTGIDCGSWGGLLSLGAKLRGVAGLVADGPVRDVDEARGLGFPIYARSATAMTARGRVVEDGTDVPIRVGDIGVAPGDFVLADSTATVFVAAGSIDEVLAAAETIFRREAEMAVALRSGLPIGAVMGGAYESMLARPEAG